MATFALSGLWHGAGWTFVLWGVFHGLIVIPFILLKRSREESLKRQQVSRLRDLPGISATLLAVTFGWVLFRSPDFTTAQLIFSAFTSSSMMSLPALPAQFSPLITMGLLAGLMMTEWLRQAEEFPFASCFDTSRPMPQVAFLVVVLITIMLFHSVDYSPEFIYFQF